MKSLKPLIIFVKAFLLIIALLSCSKNDYLAQIQIKNTLDINRDNEVVEIPLNEIFKNDSVIPEFYVVNPQTSKIIISQLVDNDMDGTDDLLLLQVSIDPGSENVYHLLPGKANLDTVTNKAFSRFVPERTDDYAWENDKVAFRTYGPEAQRMAEEGIKGGTLSSGIDCWLKKVEYPIINKWYEKHTTGKGSYHEDTGEGLDNFHVGTSRGCGGIGVLIGDSLFVSKNFSSYKQIANGPLRTSFKLFYQDWVAGEDTITEIKTITLDKGNNLMKVEVEIYGTDKIVAGLTLHEKDGGTSYNKEEGWVSYWQPHGGDMLGTGIVTPSQYFTDVLLKETPVKDQSHIFIEMGKIDNKVVYLSGFGWSENKIFTNRKSWEDFLTACSKKLNTPPEIVISR